jgi:transcriptional regulator of acetoin/glycerol metabolism
MGQTPKPLSQAAWRGLCLYRWPRNVRELEKVIRNALVLAQDAALIDLEHLPPVLTAAQTPAAPRRGRPGAGPPPSRSQLEEVLASSHGNVAEAARALGRHTACVWRWLREQGVDPASFRPPRLPRRPAHP